VVPDETRIRHVHAKISGWIETLYVSATGQRVSAGQPLLTIYSPELLATQEEYLRTKETAARFRGSSLPEVRRGGEELLEAARRRLELFDVPRSFLARLDRTGKPERAVPLLAPASGYATGKEVFAGQQIDPAMELYTLTDLSRVWVEASFSEAEAPALRVGQPVRISLPYDAGRELSGRIGFLAPTLVAESRTLQARIELANPGLALRPGMYVDVATELGAQRGTVVPDSAVIDSGLRQIAFVETGPGAFEPREVRVGLRADGKALVLAGVAPGERVATRANFLLDSESRLRGAIADAPLAQKPRQP
jgi:membrane fusion protein, copper/silver efflux system